MRRGKFLSPASASIPWACGRRRDRPQEVHLRSLGRDREPREPHGISWAKRGDPDHAQHLRSGSAQFDCESAGTIQVKRAGAVEV
jgi:hypothetical protein